MLYAYCVRRAGEPAPGPDLTGIAGAPVTLVEEGELALWVSEGVARRATVERLREHDRVVRAALRTATPLPIRYGTGFAGEGPAKELLREKRETFLEALERVAGRVEMAVRVRWDPPAPAPDSAPESPATGPGRAYLEKRRRERIGEEWRRRSAEEVLGEIEDFFSDLELPVRRTVLSQPDVAGSLAHLVHRRGVRRYRERMEQARNHFFPMELLPSGPWAPYSFV